MTLKTLWLTIHLLSGTRLVEPVTARECEAVIFAAEAAQALGGILSTDHEGEREYIGRISCGDSDVVLAIMPSEMPCEDEA